MGVNIQPVYCSIGENCLRQAVLDRLKVASVLSPFAWARSNIDYIQSILEEDFADFLNPDFLHYRQRYQKLLVTNFKYRCAEGVFDPSVSQEFEFSHHDVLKSEEARASMLRKVDRFRGLLRSDGMAVFLYHHRLSSDLTPVTRKLRASPDPCRNRFTCGQAPVPVYMPEQLQDPSCRTTPRSTP